MQTTPNEPIYSLSESDQTELNKLVSVLELSDGTTTIFAIAPESGPQHPVVEELKSLLSESEEGFQFQNFFYSDNSLHNFLYGLDEVERQTNEVRSPQPPLKRGAMEVEGNRLVVMAFGIDQLPTPRLVREMKQLNLGRDSLFQRELVLIFWLNKVEFLDEFRNRAPDFWDWRGKVVQFEARPVFNPLFYPYLEWLIAENSYLKISGVMQVQRQVDIFLDQIYVSLQAVRRQQVTETSERGHRELEMMTSRHVGKGRRGGSALDELELLDEVEPLVPDFVPTAVSTKTVTQKVDLSQAVRENQYCVILGAPGAGKTTLLRYLALHFGMAKRDGMEHVAGGEGQEELGKPLLPVFFRIADYAERLAQEPDLSLLDYLRQFYRQWEVYFETSSSSHSQGYIRPPTPPTLGGTGVQSCSEARPQDTASCPPNPPILGGTGIQNSSNLGRTSIQSPPDLGRTGIQSPLELEGIGIQSPLELEGIGIQSPPELGDLGGEIEGSAHPELPPQPPLLRGELELEGGGDADIPQLLCEQMRQGQCLMLLDGLDEVFDQESRRLIVERINQFVEVFSANKFVVTSRIAGYRDVRLSERFAEFTIEDMGSEQVEGFLHRWCRAVERAQQPEASEEQWQRVGDEQTRDILAAIQANEGVKRLTANPLLLTILALIHRNGSRLPHRRVELYALAVKTLTEDWQLGKKLPDAPKVVLKESEVVELLAPLAYWMHEEKPSGVVTQAEAEERLAIILAELNDDEPESESVRQAVEQFLRKVRETTGLFVERAPGVYGFMHLTFEEYFAARYIADHERSEILQLIREHLHEPRWNEPILLALGYYGVHSPRQVNKLVEELFSNLETYEPTVQDGEIKIKNASLADAILIFSDLQDQPAMSCSQSKLHLKDLLFAGQVLTQVEVNSSIRTKLVKKLVLTCLGLVDSNLEDDTITQIVRLLRQIELFNQKGEVTNHLKQLANDLTLFVWLRTIAQIVILYVACGEPRSGLINCVTDIVNQLNPWLFSGIKGMVSELGEEITPALEYARQEREREIDHVSRQALTFLIALSYIRTDYHAKAITFLEQLVYQLDNNLSPFVTWALANCYKAQDRYDKAIDYYQQSYNRLATYPQQNSLPAFWYEWGVCYRLQAKYEQSLECFQKRLVIAQQLNHCDGEADTLYEMGKVYQAWGKYEQAIKYYQQSRDLYQQLGRDKNVANQWGWIANCYRDEGKYEQALECRQQYLLLYQQLNNQSKVASAYYHLGCIYQAWDKYEQAITHFQKSCELYEQLDQQKDVANQWYWLADCYRNWRKYEQAVECQRQCLRIRQTLDDQSDVALAYYQLGCIYQDWGKYEQAIAHFQHSRELYEQLGKEKNVANQWYNLADCYKNWGKYQQAVQCELKDLAIRQQLDDQLNIARAYLQLGWIYQAWSKYEQAITYYQQSRELHEELGRDKDVSNQWYWLAVCYRNWGKYEQAVECELKDLEICQKLEDESGVALAYCQLGRIYQAWGKYEQAIAHYQQSRDLYERLAREKAVAERWYNMADTYRIWGKYEQAVESEFKNLAIRQQLDDQPNIANAYWQLGRIYQAWGKYEQAIAYRHQCRELYEQLNEQENVAWQWYWLADCYGAWGKYEQAVECELKDLAIRQQLEDQPNIADAYSQLGRIYHAWGKYEQAIAHFQHSRELYEQLGKEKDVANQWAWLAYCYKEWGKYQQAEECELKNLAICQQLENQPNTASAYGQLGHIYQAWGKYEQAIAHYQQSRELYEQLGKEKNVANQWYYLAGCYRDWGKYQQAVECELKDLAIREKLDDQLNIADAYNQLGRIYQAWGKYEQAIAHHQHSRELYEQLGKEKEVANQWYWLAVCYREWGKYQQAEAFNLLTQAEQNIRQAIQLNTASDFKRNLAYDYTSLGLLFSERLRLLPADDSSLPEQIAQFEDYYNTGLTYLTELGQTIDRAEETLDMARAYLEINALENLDRAEALAQESLQIFQDYNRRKLEAAAHKLLGEIYLKRAQRNQPHAEATAHQFLSKSLQLYRELDLTEKAAEVEQLMQAIADNAEQT